MRPVPSPRRAGFLLASLLLACAGCLGSDGGKVKIHGQVTLDNEPVQTGAINFKPTDGKSQTAGALIKGGEYTAEVPPGSMKVEISSPKVVGKKKMYDTPNSPTMDVTKEAIPEEYNARTGLTVEISASKPEVNFELKSKK